MTAGRTIDPTQLTAIDVQFHLEAPKSGNAADEAAMHAENPEDAVGGEA